MKPVQILFAELTAAVEDVHAIAVEGQHPEQSPDAHRALVAHVRAGAVRIGRMATAICNALDQSQL